MQMSSLARRMVVVNTAETQELTCLQVAHKGTPKKQISLHSRIYIDKINN